MKNRHIFHAVQLALIIVIAVSLVLAWNASKETQKDTTVYRETIKTYTTQQEKPQTVQDEGNSGDKEITLGADFTALRGQNADVCAWLMIPGTDINYPVVQGEDNTKYLSTGWDGKYARAGAAFIDSRQTISDSKNIIVYGHSMSNSDSVMFSELRGYEDAEFCASHPYFYMSFADDPIGTPQCIDEIQQPDGQYRFDIIAVCKVNTGHEEDINRFYWFDCDDELQEEYLQTLKNNSLQELKLEGTPCMFVTLSTCSRPGMGGNEKLIIVGALYSQTLTDSEEAVR